MTGALSSCLSIDRTLVRYQSLFKRPSSSTQDGIRLPILRLSNYNIIIVVNVVNIIIMNHYHTNNININNNTHNNMLVLWCEHHIPYYTVSYIYHTSMIYDTVFENNFNNININQQSFHV